MNYYVQYCPSGHVEVVDEYGEIFGIFENEWEAERCANELNGKE